MKTAFGSPCARNRLAGALVVIGLLPGCVEPKHPIYESKLTTIVSSPIYPQQKISTAFTELTVNPTSESAAHAPALLSFTSLPLSFEVNHGQSDPEVKFISRGSGYTLFLTDKEAVLALRHPRKTSTVPKNQDRTQPNIVESSVLRMQIVGGETNPEVAGQEELPGKSNYFIGNDPQKWHTNVPHYKRVKYNEVYPGIDLVYYGNQGRLEYDFIVAAGADPRVIEIAFSGADRLEMGANGVLVAHTGGGSVRLEKPMVYQGIGGKREKIEARYVIKKRDGEENNDTTIQIATTVGFQLAAYDTTKPLIIDPVLTYSTYLGGSAFDHGSDISVDSAGNMYVTGETASTNFPVQNALRGKNSGSGDVFITKLNAAGSALVYSTYLGGSGADFGNSIALDAAGNVYVTGETRSTNFPTMNAIQAKHGGGTADAFITKVNVTGSALVYSTYLGGNATDEGWAIAVDIAGNAYLTGATESTNFPNANALQPSFAGERDGFITKLNAAGSALVFSTYLGGTGYDYGRAMVVDATGSVYVAGITYSSDFPTMNPIQATHIGVSSDAFIAKLNAAGSALVYSTYLGGSNFDTARAIAVDSVGNVHVTGNTESTDFPTVNPIDSTLDGFNDLFVAKINTAGNVLVYSTYLGGSDEDSGNAIAVDAAGNAYIGGNSNSTDFPTINAIQPKYPGSGLSKAIIVKLNASGSALVFSTYFGGSGTANERVRGLALDAAGNIYVAGNTSSTDMPTVNPIQGKISGSFEPSDAFVAKLSQVVNCPANSLQFAIDHASPGEVVSVKGTCSENILIRNEKQRITIDGAGGGAGTRATVNGGTSSPTFNVRGKGILIQNFNINGGSDGMVINRGSNAVLNNNVIQNSSGTGVVVEQLAYSVLTNNTIQNHPASGVSISENSTARVGFNADSEIAASPNTIQSNGIGVFVSQGSSARIVGNTIAGNIGAGIYVLRDAAAEVSSNTISSNGSDGITVEENSFVQLGEDTGTSIFETANSTPSNNTGFGIRCTTGGAVDGRRGSLTGNLGPTSFAENCGDGLIP